MSEPSSEPSSRPSGAARIERLRPEALDEEQRALYDAIAGGPRSQGPQAFRLLDEDGTLDGPFNAFLLQPRLGQPLQALGAAVRYQTSLTDRAREIAILVVAAQWESAFEWHAHAAVGRLAGLTDGELAAVRAGDYDGLDETERLVARITNVLAAAGDLDDASYAAAVTAFGEAGLFELLTLTGYYAALALQLRVFRVPAPS